MSVFEGHREFGTGKIPGHAEGEAGMGTEGPGAGARPPRWAEGDGLLIPSGGGP